MINFPNLDNGGTSTARRVDNFPIAQSLDIHLNKAE